VRKKARQNQYRKQTLEVSGGGKEFENAYIRPEEREMRDGGEIRVRKKGAGLRNRQRKKNKKKKKKKKKKKHG